ncbi:MAG: aminotransferase class I/II-fold pyridoxal phosphate-dependent enzyme, partial [Thiovulaceae bacterium]|nr:aminotransferase class I/II-fold pyridoxal phosphate-dependent enzyme [Sulfurimonadaceae bacterium]
ILLNDECYSEIYTGTPPPSLLEASIAAGNESFDNVVVINSISKRSSAPGLRSGFIAGDAKLLKEYMQYRTYVGCASPLPLQYAAAAAWEDEDHVEKARQTYKNNFEIAEDILDIKPADATFYLWIKVEDDEAFTKYLFESQSVKVLPGSYLGRNGVGRGYIRIALVEDEAKTKDALKRLVTAMERFENGR